MAEQTTSAEAWQRGYLEGYRDGKTERPSPTFDRPDITRQVALMNAVRLHSRMHKVTINEHARETVLSTAETFEIWLRRAGKE